MLLHRFDLFKKRSQCLRVVAGLVEVLHSEVVGIGFKTSCETEKAHGYCQACDGARGVTNPAADKNQRNRREVHDLAASVLARRMASSNMRDFMGHHAR